MKRIALLALFVGLLTTTVSAQDASIDARLHAKFNKEELAKMQQDDPEALAFWTYYLDHGYTVMDMPKGKGADLPSIDFNESNFNLLAQKIVPQEVGNRYFRINGSGKLLAVHSFTDVKTKYKASK